MTSENHKQATLSALTAVANTVGFNLDVDALKVSYYLLKPYTIKSIRKACERYLKRKKDRQRWNFISDIRELAEQYESQHPPIIHRDGILMFHTGTIDGKPIYRSENEQKLIRDQQAAGQLQRAENKLTRNIAQRKDFALPLPEKVDVQRERERQKQALQEHLAKEQKQ